MPTLSSSTLWNGDRAPVTLLGGVLGSGKTTLLNRLLAESGGRRLVVLVNDVGDIAVDAALIASTTENVIELTNGCVCCSMTDGLGEALEDLRQLADPPEHVIVELSGVAEPARVVGWASTAGFRLDAVVVCVDAERIERQLTDRWLADTVRAQLRSADLVVLTKTDLVDRAPSLVAHTGAPILDASTLELDVLLAVDRDLEPEFETEEQSATDWVVSSLRLPEPVALERFRLALDALPDDVIRLKGFVTDQSGGCWLVQGVGERRGVSPVASEVPGDRHNWGVVAIATPGISIDELDAALRALYEPE